ncbi:UPF0126 domain-containing protein [Ochromonadaceae sp. CCMP2298]|nr:UPF0126 domain-containing protein [Ochromonadaceae sp. CCMP2298]
MPLKQLVSALTRFQASHPYGITRFPGLTSPQAILRLIDLVGTVSFACSGTVTAGYAGMNGIGCTVVGTITAVGGGTIRDILLGKTPVFWLVEQEYIVITVVTSLLTFLLWGRDHRGGKMWAQDGPLLFWSDTLGLGAFCVIGAMAGVRNDLNPLLCVVIGLISSTFGG